MLFLAELRCPPHWQHSLSQHPCSFLYLQDVAERIAREARARHYQPRVLPMDAYDVRMLPEEEQVILVASTTGQVCFLILKDPVPRMNTCQKIHGKPVQTSPKNMKSMRGTPLCVVQGELPSNMRAFWRFLLRKNLPADSLSGLSFAAFGLGDSGKPFCMAITCAAWQRVCIALAAMMST